MPRYFIQISYDGIPYHGWQVQENTPHTVQQVLDHALSSVLNEKIGTTGCGRTDTGVHAPEFFAHFDSAKTDLHADPRLWLFKINSFLPPSVAAHRIIPVPTDAHARFDAVSRTYEYIIARKKDPFYVNRACYLYGELDVESMNKAAGTLPSYRDFNSFSKSNTQVKTSECKVHYAGWEQQGDQLVLTIKANRFLRNMVRAIVGTLLEIGKGKISPEEFDSIIKSGDRSEAGASVPACGLYLVRVEYPENVVGSSSKQPSFSVG